MCPKRVKQLGCIPHSASMSDSNQKPTETGALRASNNSSCPAIFKALHTSGSKL